jgi:hypothetical protein
LILKAQKKVIVKKDLQFQIAMSVYSQKAQETVDKLYQVKSKSGTQIWPKVKSFYYLLKRDLSFLFSL